MIKIKLTGPQGSGKNIILQKMVKVLAKAGVPCGVLDDEKHILLVRNLDPAAIKKLIK